VFLLKMDRKIRAAVRDLLHLPNDTLLAFFYSAVEDGGLGVHCMTTMIRRIRYRRLLNVEEKSDSMLEHMVELETWREMVEKAERNTKLGEMLIRTRVQEKDFWRSAVVGMVDGRGLREARTAAKALWVRNPPKFLSGREYVDLTQLKIHALPTKARCARGQNK
ncbi:hypothetical protein HPB47_013799, partial [Ixodes persulcatus]